MDSTETKLVTSNFKGILSFWDFEGNLLKEIQAHLTSTSITLVPDKNQFISTSSENTLKVWDFNGNNIKTIVVDETEKHYYFIQITNDSQEIVVEALQCNVSTKKNNVTFDSNFVIPYNNSLNIYNFDGICLKTIENNEFNISCFTVTKNKKYFIMGSFNLGLIGVWNFEGICLEIIKAHSGSISSLTLISYDKQLISTAEDGEIKIWDLTAI